MRLAKVLFPLLLMSGMAAGQGVRWPGSQIVDSNGKPVRNATVRVCDEPATGATCSPLAVGGIFSDRALTVPLINPATGDANGNPPSIYVVPGRYHIQITHPSITQIDIPDVTLSGDTSFPQVNYTAVSFSATPTFDASLGTIFAMTLTGNVTSTAVSNPSLGRLLQFQLCQDGVGGRTFAWPSDFDSAPTLDARASKCHLSAWFYNGTKWKMFGQGGDSLELPSASVIMNGTAVLTLPTASDVLLGRNTVDTLTNKTIAAAGLPIAGATSGTTTLVAAGVASGTLNLPATTDTLVARNTTDTLTNKTLTNPTINAGGFTGTITGSPTFSGNPIFSGLPVLPAAYSVSTANLTSFTISNPGAPRTINFPDPTANAAVLYDKAATIDCTLANVVCTTTSKFTVDVASCNNATSGAGLDNFPTSSPTPNCVIGSNVVKGVLSYPAALSFVQQNTGSAAASTTVTTTYPATTVANNLLIAIVGVYGNQTVSGCTDTTNAYTKAINVSNGSAAGAEIWYFLASTSKTAGTTLTCTLSGAQNSTLTWLEYSGQGTAAVFDKSGTNTGTGTAVTVTTSLATTQATELVIPAFAAVGNRTASTGQAGYTLHSLKNQSTNGTSGSEGAMIQATGSPTNTFTLDSSVAWAAVNATFKVPSVVAIQGQRTYMLPEDFSPGATAVYARIKWGSQQIAAATANVVWAVAMGCTPDGSTDDPAFNSAITVVSAVPTTANVESNVLLTPLSTAGCTAGSLAHFSVQRVIANSSDTFEGRADVTGLEFTIGRVQ